MIAGSSTLADVCFAVSDALGAAGIAAVLTGGSAAAVYAPNAYMSYDADFILDADDGLATVASALASIGFRREGRSRIFAHAETSYTIDFPKGPLAVGRAYVRETRTLERNAARLRILTPTDCVRDRLAHFYYWDDRTALLAAVGVARAQPDDIDRTLLRTWTENEDPSLIEKYREFERRLDESECRNE